MRTLKEVIATFSPEKQKEIATRSQAIIAEEKALRHLRRARALTQQSMAKLLHVDQASVSKIEKRSDMLLSTLRIYVEAMGGSLRLVAAFPDGKAELLSLDEDAIESHKTRKPQAVERSKRRRPELVHTNN